MKKRSMVAAAALALLAGCTGGNDEAEPMSFQFRTGGFTVPAGQEFYHCWFVKAPTGGTAENPVGATTISYTAGSSALHHIIVFTGSLALPEQNRECALIEAGWSIRYAGGTVTDPLQPPPGVAVPMRPEEMFIIQMHYLNAGDVDVQDDTVVDVQFTKPGDTFEPAGLIVMGSDSFQIPASTTGYDVVETCNLPAATPDVEVYAIWPHMHQKGRHFNIVKNGTETLIDTDYAFGDQPLWIFDDPIPLTGGDSITTTCTYDNPDTAPVGFGESSNQEMCYDFFFYWPQPAGVPNTAYCL